MWKQTVRDLVVHALIIVSGTFFAFVFLKIFSPTIEAAFRTSTIDNSLTQARPRLPTSAARGMALAEDGNVYIAGDSGGTWGNPVRPFGGGESDAFIAKLDSKGTLIWNTFLGGSERDYGYAIAVDPKGDAYIAGNSWASWGSPVHPFHSFLTWLLFPAFELPKPAAFVAKLDRNGALLWNTFPGSTSAEFAQGIAVDEKGNVAVTGFGSASWGRPIHPYAGANNAFVARLDANGFAVWNTFVDSGWDDYGNGIVLDAAGNSYITGQSSPRDPSKTSAFVAKLDNRGAQVWNTLLGSKDRYTGSNGTGIALDGAGDIFVTGRSSATWGSPVNPFVIGHSSSGGANAFVAKLDGSGVLAWNTFVSEGYNDQTAGMALDANGNVYTAGTTNATWGRPVRPYSGGPDAFLTKLDSTGALAWTTFLGGRGEDYGMGIAADRYGNVYTVGTSASTWGNPLYPISAPSEPYSSFSAAFAARLLGNTGALTWNTFLGSAAGAP